MTCIREKESVPIFITPDVIRWYNNSGAFERVNLVTESDAWVLCTALHCTVHVSWLYHTHVGCVMQSPLVNCGN